MCKEIYAVTNRKLCERPFLEQVERVCAVRPAALILREKDLSPEAYKKLAQNVLPICKKHQVPCILHTYYKEAKQLGTDRIHLPLPVLREMPAAEKNFFTQIGCSVHSVGEAAEAVQLGATYLTAGHIYDTDCKKGLAPRGIDFLREVCEAVPLPVYAIGGIHLQRADSHGISIEEAQQSQIAASKAAGACIMSQLMKI
jgi:thiamine-phosphate pyrophosphorylase